MNSYELALSGSGWLLFLLVMIIFIFTIIIYNKSVPKLEGWRLILLIMLRSLALSGLIFFFFEPVLSHSKYLEKKPKLIMFFDNSASLGATDAKGDRKVSFKKALELLFSDDDIEDISEYHLFSSDVKKIDKMDFDSLDFSGSLTNISKALTIAGDNAVEDNIQAALIITDGMFNSGFNPIYTAENFGKPVYIIGIGDSLFPKDIAITNLLINEIGYVNSSMPVNVNVELYGYKKDSLSVVLYENNSIIGRQTINVSKDKSIYSLIFDYKPLKPGNHKITAKIAAFKGELNVKNNVNSSFVKILENKRKISIFAGAPNPDITFLKSFLEKDKAIEVNSYIQKKGDEFYTSPNELNIEKSELIILIDFPNQYTSDKVIALIEKQLGAGKPILFIAGYNTNYKKLQGLEEYLPFNTLKSGKREFSAAPNLEAYSLASPLVRITDTEEDINIWNNLPPIYKTETFVRSKPESRVIATLKSNNVIIQEPLLMSRHIEGKKSIAIMGYGLYRWKLMKTASENAKGNSDSYDVYSMFMNNCLKWLSVSEQNKTFVVKPTKKQYAIGEAVFFNGELYDAAYNPIENADISIKISKKNKPNQIIREIDMKSIGNGRYTADLSGLDKADYIYNASAVKGEKLFNKENGIFSVGDISPEFAQLRMNVENLREIAKRTGGKFVTAENADKLWEIIESHKKFTSNYITLRNDLRIWDKWQILILSILLFATEWLLRKRYGML